MGLAYLPHFVHNFSRKIFLMLHSINWPSFIVCLSSWHIGQYVYCNYLLSSSWCHKRSSHNFLLEPFFFLHNQKVRTKNINIWKTKRAFKMKWKWFLIIFKGLSWPLFCGGESSTFILWLVVYLWFWRNREHQIRAPSESISYQWFLFIPPWKTENFWFSDIMGRGVKK